MGGPTPFLPMEKCVFSHFSPWGKMEKKVYGKKGKSIHFPLFPYTFFPMGKNGKKYIEREGKDSFPSLSIYFFPHFFPWGKMGKMGNDKIFPWAKMGLDPPNHMYIVYITYM